MRYSEEYKATVLEKLLEPDAPSVEQLSREERVPVRTLYRWRSQLRPARGVRAIRQELTQVEQLLAETVARLREPTGRGAEERTDH